MVALSPLTGGTNAFLYIGIGLLVVALAAIVALVIINKRNKK